MGSLNKWRKRSYDFWCNDGRWIWDQPYMLLLMADAGVTSRNPTCFQRVQVLYI